MHMEGASAVVMLVSMPNLFLRPLGWSGLSMVSSKRTGT